MARVCSASGQIAVAREEDVEIIFFLSESTCLGQGLLAAITRPMFSRLLQFD